MEVVNGKNGSSIKYSPGSVEIESAENEKATPVDKTFVNRKLRKVDEKEKSAYWTGVSYRDPQLRLDSTYEYLFSKMKPGDWSAAVDFKHPVATALDGKQILHGENMPHLAALPYKERFNYITKDKRPIPADSMIQVPIGTKYFSEPIVASEYFRQLNEIEKSLNENGYSLDRDLDNRKEYNAVMPSIVTDKLKRQKEILLARQKTINALKNAGTLHRARDKKSLEALRKTIAPHSPDRLEKIKQAIPAYKPSVFNNTIGKDTGYQVINTGLNDLGEKSLFAISYNFTQNMRGNETTGMLVENNGDVSVYIFDEKVT